MSTTITLPTGHKARTQSRRRYVMFGICVAPEIEGAVPFVEKRSDDFAIIKEAARKARRSSPNRHQFFVVDQTTGSIVQ